MKGLTAVPGLRVGHASDYDALTGCTAILCEEGAVAGADIRGSATGTEEFSVLEPGHVAGRVHAVVLAGGSAFGVEAASGVRRYLERKGIGFETRAARVPIVPCAIIYDLAIGRADVRPTREMGEAAAAAATSDPVREGAVGAGTGATVGKLFGMERAMKAGIGSFAVALEGAYEGVVVAALAVVNAFGDVIDPKTGRIVAGARRSPEGLEFADSAAEIKRGARPGFTRENTTLAVVATNARLDRIEARKLAQQAQIGMARTVNPVNTMVDGDLVIALSLGDRRADLNALGIAAAEAVSEAILRAVRLAPTLGGIPGLAGD
ncbi:MAG TPA: P1 family peptidase [Bryobacteraceae bacterium]|nr:P1 family peptidase [Bryobacteraceae bacterium]HOL73731.1 P1 family peptidase [Bryobacteraceae bacterium]HOQ43752.1 P1 family peptidase [Bryobacteraceae bacterium]HPQ14460.1 P1 family peptidase [Bryobacteraceae bacterium]HPU71805.1 P1 family peptidase [Bryobacteraceae bacterium]